MNGAQAGWTQSAGPGSFTINDGVGDQNFGNNNFGNFQRATISGEKYDDTNGNRARDGGEPTLPGWDIHLDGTDGMGNAASLAGD